MSQPLRKRGREPEDLPDSTDVRESKRFNGEDTDRLDETLVEEEDCAFSEDFVSGVMKSLEEEISATCSTFYAPISGDNSPALDCSSGQIIVSASDADLSYLLKASDDELSIPSNTVLDSNDKFCQFTEETLTAGGEGLYPDLKGQGENWDFEAEFEKYQQFALYEDAWDASQVQDYMNRDFMSQEMFFDEDYSATSTVETAGCM